MTIRVHLCLIGTSSHNVSCLLLLRTATLACHHLCTAGRSRCEVGVYVGLSVLESYRNDRTQHCSLVVTVCVWNSVCILIMENAFTENLDIMGKYWMASSPTVVVEAVLYCVNIQISFHFICCPFKGEWFSAFLHLWPCLTSDCPGLTFLASKFCGKTVAMPASQLISAHSPYRVSPWIEISSAWNIDFNISFEKFM